MALTEEKLQRLVSLMVEKKIILLKEGKKFQAIRSLTIEAQTAAKRFEDSMVKTLGLVDPDEMPDEAQQIYAQAMSDLHSKFIEAVVHAANVLKHLPEDQSLKADDAPKKPASKPVTGTSSTVHRDLPTLQLNSQ